MKRCAFVFFFLFIFLFSSKFTLAQSEEFQGGDTLKYLEEKFDMLFSNVTSPDTGVFISNIGKSGRLTAPGRAKPEKCIIKYIGTTDSKEELKSAGKRIRTTNDLQRAIVDMNSKGVNTAYFLVRWNGSVTIVYHAPISDIKFITVKPDLKSEKNSIYNLTVFGITPQRIRNGDSNCVVVIARDTCMIKPYVQALKIKYENQKTKIDWWHFYNSKLSANENMDNAENWMRGRISDNCTIIDLGCDSNYACNERGDHSDCGLKQTPYDRQLLAAFGEVDPHNPPHITTAKATDVKPTNVQPTNVQPKKMERMNPFQRQDGIFRRVIYYAGIGIALKNIYIVGDEFKALNTSMNQSNDFGEAYGYLQLYSGCEISLNAKHTFFTGVELQINHSAKQAVVQLGAFSSSGGGNMIVNLNWMSLNFPFGIGIGKLARTAFILEPGTNLGYMGGHIKYGVDGYIDHAQHGIGAGVQMAAGFNFNFGSFGVRVRGGYRHILVPLTEFTQPVKFDWSGYFFTIGFDHYFK